MKNQEKINKLADILNYYNEPYYKHGDEISVEEVNYLSQRIVGDEKTPPCKTQYIKDLVEKRQSKDDKPIIAHCLCDGCGAEIEFKISKYTFVGFLQSKKMCKKCTDAMKKRNEEATQESIKKLEKREWDNYVFFIDTFLDPGKFWSEGITSGQKIHTIKDYYPFLRKDLRDQIKKYIKDLPYYDFLKTPYWKAISERVKYKNHFKCSLCGSNNNLSVHHKTYEHHGEELFHMEDLFCLCQNCHDKFHDTLKHEEEE